MDPVLPAWANPEHTLVRIIADGVESLIPVDPENRNYAALISDKVEIAAYHPPPPQVPEGILRHQGLVALLSVSITEQAVREKIALTADPTQREMTRLRFEQPEWRRDSEFFAWLSSEFSLAQEDVDALLIVARAA